MRDQLMRRLRASAFVLVALLGFAAAAQAAVYVGKWDPPYGEPFDNLGWRGEIKIDAPTNCGAGSGFSGVVTCTPGAATVSYAFVELYLLDQGPTFPTASLLTFAPVSLSVTSLEFTGGVLTGAITTRSAFIHDPLNDVDFALQFVLDGLPSVPGLPDVPGADTYSGPVLWYRDKVCIEEHHKKGDYDHDDDCDCYKTITGVNDLNSPDTKPNLVFTQVPEPSSLALVLVAGLAAGGLRRGARRRVG
jgi:hypothetical protein